MTKNMQPLVNTAAFNYESLQGQVKNNAGLIMSTMQVFLSHIMYRLSSNHVVIILSFQTGWTVLRQPPIFIQ